MTANTKTLFNYYMKQDLREHIWIILGSIIGYLTTITLVNLNIIQSNFFTSMPLIHLITLGAIGWAIIGSFMEGIRTSSEISEEIRYGITRKEFSIANLLSMLIWNIHFGIFIGILMIILRFNFATIATAFLVLTITIWSVYFSVFAIGLLFVRTHWYLGVFIIAFVSVVMPHFHFNVGMGFFFDVDIIHSYMEIFPERFQGMELEYILNHSGYYFEQILAQMVTTNTVITNLVTVLMAGLIAWLQVKTLPVKVK